MESVKTALVSFLGNDVVERALKTFLQAFVGSLIVTGFAFDQSTLVAALAAGLSAAWNYLKAQ